MLHLNKQNCSFGFILAGVYCAAWWMQDQFFLNWDVSYLLHATQLLLSGGTYTRDFFTPNPPLILYLYAPPLLLHQDLSVNLVLAVRGYLFLLASFSLGLCSFFAHALFKKEIFIRNVFLSTLALVFLILPFYDFGQREHLLIIFTLPYLLLVTARLQNIPLKKPLAILVGFLAGLGFSLKPQFYIVPFFIELYYLYSQKKYFAWLRAETLAMLSVLVAYVALLFLFYPDYLTVLVPYLLRHFYGSIGQPGSSLLFNHVALFCCLPLLLHLVLYKKNPYKKLSQILACALLGFFCAYLAQHTTFYYHLLPAFSIAILLQVLLYSSFVSQPAFSWTDYGSAALLSLLALTLFFYQAKLVWLMPLFATSVFFCFFGFLFIFLLLATPRRPSALRIVLSVSLVLALSFLCFYLAQRTSWSSDEVLITILVLLALFGLAAPRTQGGVGTTILLAVLGMLLFAHPVFFSYSWYERGQEYKEKVLHKLIVFMRAQTPHRSIYVFSMKGSYGSPLVDYTGSHLAQRFDCLWPALAFVRHPKEWAFHQTDKTLFINMVAEDLQMHQPDLIFVDLRDYKMLAWDKHFNYLRFFSQNPQFRKEWQAYRYLTTLKEEPIYTLAVYKRLA